MANGGKDRASRDARERARLYQARREFHAEQARRRTRDNLVAGIAGGLLILGLVGAQTAYFLVGPGAPTPSPSSTPSPSVTPAVTPTPSVSPEATPGMTPSPTPTP